MPINGNDHVRPVVLAPHHHRHHQRATNRRERNPTESRGQPRDDPWNEYLPTSRTIPAYLDANIDERSRLTTKQYCVVIGLSISLMSALQYDVGRYERQTPATIKNNTRHHIRARSRLVQGSLSFDGKTFPPLFIFIVRLDVIGELPILHSIKYGGHSLTFI